MGLLNFFNHGYLNHPEAVVVSCFFNPQRSPYRLKAFQKFYASIKHLNHAIVECVIGDSTPQLPKSPFIQQVYTQSWLWHKEGLLNYVIASLPPKYKYVFWVDADVLLMNRRWLVEAVEVLQRERMVQPFEFCIHLEQDEVKPGFDVELARPYCGDALRRHPRFWRSFGANHVEGRSDSLDYHIHGHVGFAWGVRRSVLDQVPLFDRALIGGADHIMAHAAAGHIPHPCITKAFRENSKEVLDWSRRFYSVIEGRIGFVPGDLYHLWHGAIEQRRYFERIREFTERMADIVDRDESGLFVSEDHEDYVANYFQQREVTEMGEPSDDPVNSSETIEGLEGSIQPLIDETTTQVNEFERTAEETIFFS